MALEGVRYSNARPAAIAAGLGIVLGLGMSAPLLAQSSARVSIDSVSFGPSKVTVSKGGSVTWVNTDSSPHSVVVSSAGLKTPTLQKGKSARLKFAKAGTFNYVCGLHSGMTGTVEVK